MGKSLLKSFIFMFISLIFLNFGFAYADSEANMIEKNTQDKNIYTASYYHDLDAKGNNFITKNGMKKINVEIEKFYIKSYKAKIKGNLSMNGLKFDLEGSLAKTERNNSIFLKLRDKNNNFDVVYSAIEKINFEHDTENIQEVISEKPSNIVFKLYLMEKNTRNFVELEISSSNFISTLNRFHLNAQNLKTADYEDEFWFLKIIKPENIETIDCNSESGKNSVVIIDGPTTDGDIKLIRYTYNSAGRIFYQDTTVSFYMNGSESIKKGQIQPFQCKMSIIATETWSSHIGNSDEHKLESRTTSTRIGYRGPLKIDAYTEVGSNFSSLLWDGDFFEGNPKLNVNVSLGYSLLGLPVTFGINYEPEKHYSSNLEVIENRGEKYCRTAGTVLKDGKYLKDINNSFITIFDVKNCNQETGKYQFRVKFTYYLYSPYDDSADPVNGARTIELFKNYFSN